MAEIIKCYRESLPVHRFIGKCYFNSDKDENGTFMAKWGEWFQKGWFSELEKLDALAQNEGAYFGLLRWKKHEPFQYWIGIFFPENTAVPEGYGYVDFPAGDVGVCWVYGSEKNDNIYSYHDDCVQKMMQSGFDMKDNFGRGRGEYWLFERYNCPRYTTPDQNNKIILDYCCYINKGLKKVDEIKKVRVCRKCSGFDVTELKGKVKAKDYATGCIGKCMSLFPELGGKVYGLLNGKFVVCSTKNEFFAKIDEIL